MSKADEIYLSIAKDILENGVEHQVKDAYYKEDGSPVFVKKSRNRVIMEFDLQEEFPALTGKKHPLEPSKIEMFWFYVWQSNLVAHLHEHGVSIWDAWKGADGTIGLAYGYQIKKYKQIDRLINTIKNNPDDRGMVMSLWNEEDLPHMNIRPCAFMTMWDVTDGLLNCTLVQRSGDWGLGIPFNFSQYAMLTHMIAHVTGLKAGKLTHIVNNAHIYNKHYDQLQMQLTRPQHPAPKIWINPDVKDFYDFTLDDVQIKDYVSEKFIKMDIAVVVNPFKENKQ